MRALWWYEFELMATWDSWRVPLPGGGSVRYASRSPQMRFFGPADTEKTLTWNRPEGPSQSYPIVCGGGGFDGLEIRLREDARTLWLVDLGKKAVVATLDLTTGKYTSDGAVYSADGEQSMDEFGTPAWATRKGGRVLAQKTFR